MTKQGKTDFSKGKRSELVVLLALQRLRDKGEITEFHYRDEPGIDFRVNIPDCRRRMPLQVKSSYGGQRIHHQKYSYIPCVVVAGASRSSIIKEDLIQRVSQDILDCIEEFRSSR